MAGRGMGAATKGGGAVSSGPRNRMVSEPSKKVEVMMAKGGSVKKNMGGGVCKSCGGMMHKKKGGMVCKACS